MSYMRGDIYIWADGTHVHFWACDPAAAAIRSDIEGAAGLIRRAIRRLHGTT